MFISVCAQVYSRMCFCTHVCGPCASVFTHALLDARVRGACALTCSVGGKRTFISVSLSAERFIWAVCRWRGLFFRRAGWREDGVAGERQMGLAAPRWRVSLLLPRGSRGAGPAGDARMRAASWKLDGEAGPSAVPETVSFLTFPQRRFGLLIISERRGNETRARTKFSHRGRRCFFWERAQDLTGAPRHPVFVD